MAEIQLHLCSNFVSFMLGLLIYSAKLIQPANHQQNLRPLQLSVDLIGPLVLPPINSAVISIDLEEFYLLLHYRGLRRKLQ